MKQRNKEADTNYSVDMRVLSLYEIGEDHCFHFIPYGKKDYVYVIYEDPYDDMQPIFELMHKDDVLKNFNISEELLNKWQKISRPGLYKEAASCTGNT